MRLKITDILEQLSDLNYITDEESANQAAKTIFEYYSEAGRHNYNEISEYILHKFSTPSDSEAISIIADNIESLIAHIDKKMNCEADVTKYQCLYSDIEEQGCERVHIVAVLGHGCYELKKAYVQLNKLLDHVKLEFLRTSELRAERERINSTTEQLKSELCEANEQMEYLSSNINETESKYWKLEENTRNIYLQVVSILEIFAAIVIAVFGGLNVINAITSAFIQGEITVYKTVLVSAMCALFVIWVIFTLLGLIRWFRFEASPAIYSIITFIAINVICIIAIIWALKQSGQVSSDDVAIATNLFRYNKIL